MTVQTIPTYKQPIIEDESTNITRPWFFFFQSLYKNLSPGISATITTAKLTTGGTQGSMTFTNGVLTAQTQAT